MKALLAPRAACSVLSLAGLLLAGASPATAQVIAPKPAGSPENVTTIFMPAPRSLRQALNRAQAAIAEERYADAVESLGGILNGETADPDAKSAKGEAADDFFLQGANQGEALTSLKTQALQMLGAMPEKGRRLYELNYGADARAMLDSALAEGNISKLTEVARRYFHTKAGYEAAILLGRLNLDQGRPLAAALAFKRVAEVPAAAAQYDPELSLLLATSWQFAGQSDKAKETLVSLRQRDPKAKIAAGDKPVPLFERDDDAMAWLTQLVGSGGKARNADALQWIMFRGNETRTASTSASLPLLSPRWSVPAVDDPQDAQRVRQLAKNPADRILVPALQPLVVQDYVVYRTADRVIGASLKDQGKRVWFFPWDETAYDKATRNTATQPRSPVASTREQQLGVRIWDDHPFGEMSSDGQQVFLIDELGFPPVANNQMQRIFVNPRGGMFNNPFMQQTFNKLVAIDLTREGALNWKVGGESGEDDPSLAGAFFLGPPLPMAGQLFVLAEFNGEIRLLCLNAKTGSLEWKQSLAMMPEGRTITFDSVRRLAGATPSFAEGVLVCPTSGEGVAAVDLATRTLRWGYQYPRWDAVFFPRNNGFGGMRGFNDGSVKGHWIDGSVTIAGGAVLLTPIESMDLHCLDLLTGKSKWKPLPCEEMLYVGCVHGGKAILVGKKQVKAINLADGKESWTSAVDLEGDAPAGRGYYSENYYYLPTTSSQLVKIDLDKGTVAARVKTGSTLGNLVCYKDELISQSSEGIASYYLAEPLRKRTEELLAKNPNDPWALARKGEILLQDGKQDEALQMLRTAQRLAPEDLETKTMLARVMLSLLRADFAANQALAAEAEPLLADQPALRREFYRLRAQAMEKAGSPLEAFTAYLSLREQPDESGAELEEISRDHSARRDRWISARLAGLFSKADAAARMKIEAEVQSRLAKAQAAKGPAALADFADFFRFHPLATEAQLDLSRRYLEGSKLLEAELAIGELATHAELAVAGRATALLAVIYEAAERFDLAQQRYEVLGEKYSAVVCAGGRTGKELADEAAGRASIARQLAARTWPGGNVETKVSDPQGAGFGGYRYFLQMTEFRGAAPRGQRGSISPQDTAFRAYDSAGKLLSTTSLLRGGQQNFLSFPGNAATGKMAGHLTLVSGGGEILAVDSLRIRPGVNSDGLLWRADIIEPDSNPRRGMSYISRTSSANPLLGGMRYSSPEIRGAGTLGPVTAQGVVYSRGRQLVCADPFTGQIAWERTGIEPGSDIFGDEQKVVVIAPGEKSDQAVVYSAIDGSLLDRRMVDPQDHRWVTCGRNVLAWEAGENKVVQLRLYDATNQGAGMWARDVTLPAKGFILEGEELCLLEPSGKFTVVSLKSGKELMTASVDPEPELQSIAVIASRQQLLLVANRPQTDAQTNVTVMPLAAAGPPGSLVHGRVHALDRATGKAQWQTPAFVAQHALPQEQPAESPILVFARRKNVARGGTATSNVSSLLCLDRRDGSVIYEEDAFLGQASYCDISCDREAKTVTVQVTGDGTRTLQLKFTDNPTPPKPPAQTGMMSSRSLGDQLGAAVDVATDIFKALNEIPGDRLRNGRPPGMQIPLRGLRLPGLPVPLPAPR